MLKNNGWNLKNGKWQKIVDYKTTKLEFNLVVNNDSNRTGVADFIKKSLEEKKQLLVNLFVPNTPLHDGAVIISNNKIVAAACILPLANDKEIAKELGVSPQYVSKVLKGHSNYKKEKEIIRINLFH